MALVVIVGFAGIFFSRDERRSAAVGNDKTAPVANKDHWHAAVGFYLCDGFADPVTEQRDPQGIHTHGDGVIHIHPFVRTAAGNNAKLSVFTDTVRMTLTDTEIRLPGGKTFKEGSTKCAGKPAIMQVQIDGKKVVTTGIRDIKLKDRQLLTVAFAPAGTKLPEPPSRATLNNLEDVAPTGAATSSVPASDSTASTAPPADGSSATTAKP